MPEQKNNRVPPISIINAENEKANNFILIIYDNHSVGLDFYLLDDAFKTAHKDLYESLKSLSGKYINEVSTSDEETDQLCAIANFLEDHQTLKLITPWHCSSNSGIREVYLIGFLD